MIEDKNLPEFPKSWCNVTLDAISDIILGQSPPSSTYNTEGRGVPFFQGKSEFGEMYPTVKKWCNEPKKIAEKDDILISVRAPVGPTNLCPNKSCIGRGLAAIRVWDDVHTKFILYALRANENKLAGKGTGTTFKAITGNTLRKFIIPLAPFNEQKRIVDKIEELFSKINSAITELKKIEQQLKIYSDVVLKYAVDGKLSINWRKKHQQKIEPAPSLLESINRERRENKKRQKELISPNLSKLNSLPEGWVWAAVEQLNPPDRTCAYGVLQPGDHIQNGIPIIRVGDIFDGIINVEKMKRIDPKIASKYNRTKLKGGEVVISLVGAIGRTAVVPKILEGANTARAVGVIPLSKYVNPHWVELWFRNPLKIYEMTNKAHEVARKTLNLEDVRSALVAVPPISEQDYIVEESQLHLSLITNSKIMIEKNIEITHHLQLSVLKKAFEGKLVSQDLSDEPAEILLKRIQKENGKYEQMRLI